MKVRHCVKITYNSLLLKKRGELVDKDNEVKCRPKEYNGVLSPLKIPDCLIL